MEIECSRPTNRGYAKGIVLTVLVALCGMLRADEPLDSSEKTAVRDRILKTYSSITNLHVKSIESVKTEGDEGSEQRRDVEWAMGGQKRYLRFSDFCPVGESPSDRRSTAAWNGKMLVTYDTYLRAGKVLPPDTPGERPKSCITSCETSRFVGEFSRDASLPELLNTIPVEDWEIYTDDKEGTVLFATDAIEGRNCRPRIRDVWRFDLTRGALVTEFQRLVEREDGSGEFRVFVQMLTDEAREVLPGLWLPAKSHTVILDSSGKTIQETRVTVTDLQLNNAETEDLFNFTIPEGGRYYDGVLGDDFRVGMTEKTLVASMNNDIDELSSAHNIGASASKPNEVRAGADKGGMANKSLNPLRSGLPRLSSLLIVGLLILAVVVIATLFLGRKRFRPE